MRALRTLLASPPRCCVPICSLAHSAWWSMQVEARYGDPASATARALARCQAAGDPGYMGVLATLATVDDEPLARVLSLAYRGTLDALILRCAHARKRGALHVSQGE